MLQEVGFECEAVAFARPYHSARNPDCQVTVIGKYNHGRYASRLLTLARALPRLRSAIRRSDAVYAFGLDMAMIALIAGIFLGKPLFLETGDIRRIQVSRGLLGSLVRTLDVWVARFCSAIVITARGFSEYYQGQLKVATPTVLIENKLDADSLGSVVPRNGEDVIRIGYFGVLRCTWSINTLMEVARRMGSRVHVKFAGIPLLDLDLEALVEDVPNVSYEGTYTSPDDLPELYGDIDLSWTCYPPPTADKRWWWAQATCRSNRFYEGCRFGRPLICCEGSGDAEEVKKHGIGLILPDQESESVIQALEHVSKEDIRGWTSQLAKLPQSVFLYTDEANRLAGMIAAAQ